LDQFSYLSVLLSIIVGLTVTQILQAFRGIVLARTRVRMYWLPIGWAILVLVVAIQSWWAMFGLREREKWTFAEFLIVLLQNVMLYLGAGLVFPDFEGEPVDLREHYFAHHRIFFGIFVVTLLISLSKDLVLSGHLPDPLNVAFHALFIVGAAIAMLTSREWIHRLMLPLTAMLFAAYIALLFTRMPGAPH
jgi:hypothetical protein